jgi:hypothetical protein
MLFSPSQNSIYKCYNEHMREKTRTAALTLTADLLTLQQYF